MDGLDVLTWNISLCPKAREGGLHSMHAMYFANQLTIKSLSNPWFLSLPEWSDG
jgi:hypothetical protein